MADFVAVLRKTIGALGDNTPEMREMVYERARATIEAKLAAIDPPPPAVVADRQRSALEDAIAVLRAEFDGTPEAEADDDLENLFASLNADPVPVPAAKAEPASPYAAPSPSMPPAAAPGSLGGAVKPAPRAVDPVAELETVPANEHASQRRHEAIAAAGAAAVAATRKSKPKARGRVAGLVATLAVLAALGAGGYAIWINKDDFSRMIGLAPVGGGTETPEEVAAAAPEEVAAAPVEAGEPEEAVGEEEAAVTPVADQPAEEQAAAPEEPAATPEPVPAEPEQEVAALPEQEETRAAPAAPETEKFTQRLLPDGREIDEGPAGGERSVGEGTSLAAAVQPQAGEAEAATDAPPAVAEAQEIAPAQSEPVTPAVAVGQRAIFYEERTSSAQESAESGSIVWSVVQEPPGGDLPPEPAIRAEAIIPGKDVQLRMTIRRNGDQTLPAAHIVEMIFLTPDNFEGGSISNVSRIAFKETEQAAGNQLMGIPAKIADGFFLIALGDTPAEISANTTLLRRSWIDIPIVYQSGRRALLSMEKGIPGDRIFQEVLRAWSQAGSG